MWGYPLPSVIALGGWTYILATNGLQFILLGVGLMALGVVAYLWQGAARSSRLRCAAIGAKMPYAQALQHRPSPHVCTSGAFSVHRTPSTSCLPLSAICRYTWALTAVHPQTICKPHG